MCTLGAKKLKGYFFIFKNRDTDYKVKTKIKKESGITKKLLIVDEKGHCEGLNEFGLGYIGATLQPFPRTKYRTISQVGRHILDKKNILDALNIIKQDKISANIILSDGITTYLVEKTPYEFATTKIRQSGVLTNLSVKLNHKNGSKLKSIRAWASFRYNRAKKIIKDIHKFSDIRKFLFDKKGWPNKSIFSGENWMVPTRCSYIYDLKNKKIFFSDVNSKNGKFKEYRL